MPGLSPEELKKTLSEVGARWQASDKAKEYSLGYVPGPTEHSLATREMLAHGNYQHFLAMAAVAASGYPASFDAKRYWICKSNWGTAWGEYGFFCIAYGQCGIDAEMWAVRI